MVKIDFLAWETEAWLEGIREFIHLLAGAITEVSARERASLERLAREHDMLPEEYASEMQMLEHKFDLWLPKATAYSAVILLHSLVETQLYEYANRLRRVRNLRVGVADLRGQGIDAAKTYITRVAGIEFASDLGWQELKNLQGIRNIVVHRRGRQGASAEQQKAVSLLLDAYSEDLSLSDESNTAERELQISLRLCTHFVAEVDRFFQRLCVACGFQERAWKS